MQHTLTPFLIRALSKTEEEKRREKRQREKKRRRGVQTEEQGEGGTRGERRRGGEPSLLHWFLGSLAPALIRLEKPQMCRRQLGTHTHPTRSHACAHTQHTREENIQTHASECSSRERGHNVQLPASVCVDYSSTCVRGEREMMMMQEVLIPFWEKKPALLWSQSQK